MHTIFFACQQQYAYLNEIQNSIRSFWIQSILLLLVIGPLICFYTINMNRKFSLRQKYLDKKNMNDCISKSINFILSVIPWVKVAINHCTKFSIKQISRHCLLEYFYKKNSFLIYGKFSSSLSILNVCFEYNETIRLFWTLEWIFFFQMIMSSVFDTVRIFESILLSSICGRCKGLIFISYFFQTIYFD